MISERSRSFRVDILILKIKRVSREKTNRHKVKQLNDEQFIKPRAPVKPPRTDKIRIHILTSRSILFSSQKLSSRSISQSIRVCACIVCTVIATREKNAPRVPARQGEKLSFSCTREHLITLTQASQCKRERE